MSLVVETTSTVTADNASDLTLPKATGVAVGDLLIIIASEKGGYCTCTGFTSVVTSNYDGFGTLDSYINLLYRIADASDVSASNYTINGLASSMGSAVMLRVSGWTTGNPIHASATYGNQVDSASYTIDSGDISLSRPSQQLLIMAGNQYSLDNYASYNAYTIESTDSNPTWVEVIDSDYEGESDFLSMFVAYAISSDTSTITGYTVGVSSSTTGGADAYTTFLAVICSPLSQTVSNDLLQTTPVTFATLTGSTQEPVNDFHEVSPEFPEQSGVATMPSIWTPITKS